MVVSRFRFVANSISLGPVLCILGYLVIEVLLPHGQNRVADVGVM